MEKDEFGKIDSKAKIYAQEGPKPDFWARLWYLVKIRKIMFGIELVKTKLE